MAYVRQRRQFGRQIGSFQAVKHRLAEAHLAVETTRTAVWSAAQLVADHDADACTAAAVAKVAAADATAVVNQHALQCHGAIGFTVEYDLQLWLRLGKSLERAYGTTRSFRQLIATAVLADQP